MVIQVAWHGPGFWVSDSMEGAHLRWPSSICRKGQGEERQGQGQGQGQAGGEAMGSLVSSPLSRDKRWEIMEGCINEGSTFSDLTELFPFRKAFGTGLHLS